MDEQIVNTFTLEEDGSPNDLFIDELNRLGLSWKHLFIVDEVLIASVVDLSGSVVLGGKNLTNKNLIAGDYFPINDPKAIIGLQAELISNICQNIPIITLHPNYERLISYFFCSFPLILYLLMG